MNTITKVIKRNINDSNESITAKVNAYKAFVKNNQVTVDLYSLNNGSLLLTSYKEGCLKRVKLFNSCEVEKTLQSIS